MRTVRIAGFLCIGIVVASLVIACDEMVEKVPQVAGTYEGEMTFTGLVPLKLPTTATVTQSGADVAVVLRSALGQQPPPPPVAGEGNTNTLEGKIDKNGRVTVTGDSVFDDDPNPFCGAVQPKRPSLSFRDDELRLSANAKTENCGTITAMLIAKKT